MTHPSLSVALLSEVFHGERAAERLTRRLAEARAAGAELAVLPELPMDRWVAAEREPDPSDAEPPGGRRQRIMARAAVDSGLAVLGGAIILDPASGARYNTALLYDRRGERCLAYRKLHLPFEEGFWEAAHYRPGDRPPTVSRALPLALGVQICSDANRPNGFQLLAFGGVEVIVVPRATPGDTWERWRLVLRAGAVTSAAWVVTVNRPAEPQGSPVSGPSAVIAPDGRVLYEDDAALSVLRLDGGATARARADYPGYLDYPTAIYAAGWQAATRTLTEE